MGYYVQQRGEYFMIKKKNIPQTLKAVKTWANKKHSAQWVDVNTIINTKDIVVAFDEWCWDIGFDEAGNIYGINFNAEKMGDFKIFFDIIAPYVEQDSYIEMAGEDGEIWRYIFENGVCKEMDAIIDFRNSGDILDKLLETREVLPTLIGIHPDLDILIEKSLKH